MTFQLDTTGEVSSRISPTVFLTWEDLSPFTQGYVEALIANDALPLYNVATPPGFRHLAPETLARIIEECERCERGYRALGIQTIERFAGFNVWTLQQAGTLVEQGFPPLTVHLGDDGKVRFA